MKDYDFSILKELAYNACLKTHELLSELTSEELGKRVRTVYRPNDNNGMTGYHAFLPNYHSALTYDKFCEIWESEETLLFLSKLMECPLLPDHMIPKDENISSWNRMYAGQIIQGSLDRALDRTSMLYFIDGNNSPNAWSLEKSILIEVINNSIEELIENPAHKIHYIKAICPILNIEFNQKEIFLSDELSIKEWSIRDRAILLSQYNDAYLWQEDFSKSPTFSKYFIELELNVTAGESAHEVIANNIDCLKWAAMRAAESELPPSEGVCIILTKGGTRLNSIRREDGIKGVSINFDKESLDKFLELYSCFNNSSAKSNGLDKALWHFGRSCSSTIERDILLESAIGIDSIVSNESRDSSYRFRLHGSALLSFIDPTVKDTAYKELSNIYEKRSSAAHGTGSIKRSGENLHEKARMYLAKMIESVVMLNENKCLNVSKESKVPNAIQEYIINKVIN